MFDKWSVQTLLALGVVSETVIADKANTANTANKATTVTTPPRPKI